MIPEKNFLFSKILIFITQLNWKHPLEAGSFHNLAKRKFIVVIEHICDTHLILALTHREAMGGLEN